jgi:RND family efflux transporter MFP subunit
MGLLTHGAAAQLVATGTVDFRDVEETFAVEGVLEAVKQSTVASQVYGRVIAITVDVGDMVKKGDVIMRIDEHEATHALAGREAEVTQARAALQNAKASYERTRSLFEQKFISAAALDKAQSDYKAAEANLTAMLEGAGQAAVTKQFSTIVAPYSGIVSARHIEVGELATPGKPLMTGFDPKDLRAIVTVPQYKVGAIQPQGAVSVEFPTLKKNVQAKQVTLLPTADIRTHTTRVRLDLPEGIAGAYPGMFVRAYFVTGTARKLVAPASAILRRSEVTAVYVIKEKDALQLRQVRLGEPAGEREIEILAGLVPGERVALDPIKAGMQLKPAQH